MAARKKEEAEPGAVHGDPQASLSFLRWLRPAGPWVLTAIPPEGGVTTTDTFRPGEEDRLLAWVAARDGTTNLYFMVNAVRGALIKKAKKEDVEAVELLHVDVDPAKPPAGLSFSDLQDWVDKERKRILPLLQGFQPAPSAIIDSGGGYQAFWRLEEPIVVGGQVALVADAEAYNQQLEVLFHGDHCHNADRIMRLPGTVNLPDEKKRKKGRVKRVAKVVSIGDDSYALARFTPAPRVQGSSGGGGKVQISGNLPRITDLETELPEKVSLRTRMLIVQGDDPDDPTKYGSRSDVVWAVTCELVRAGCEDDIIAAVLLDPDFGISAHVRDQPRPAEYTARQIQRAKEEVEDPILRRMNEAHAVIADLGGKCRVISEVIDTSLKRPRARLSKQSFEDFRNRYMNQKVKVGETEKGASIYMPAGKWWLAHPMRRQYETLVFAPMREVPDAYNLWQGFACEAIPGSNHEPFLEHLRDNVCSGVEEHYHYLVRWFARCVQEPGEQGEVAVIFRGGRGTGKGTAVNGFGSLWGRHFMHVSNAKHLVGQFNAHLRDCVVLYGDEAFFAGDRQHEAVLKTLITEDTLIVEGKGIDAEVGPNYTHLLMSSNNDWVVPAGADERRFFVLDVGDSQKQNTTYFATVRRAMMAGGRENLLHYLMNLDLEDWDVRKVPQTEALRDQKVRSMGAEEQWWTERLMDGRTTSWSPDWQTDIMKDRLQGDYLRYCESQRIFHRLSPTAVGRFLAKVLPDPYPVSTQRFCDVEKDDGRGGYNVVKERAYWYTIPGLDECRKFWNDRYGDAFTWPTDAPAIEGPAVGRDPY